MQYHNHRDFVKETQSALDKFIKDEEERRRIQSIHIASSKQNEKLLQVSVPEPQITNTNTNTNTNTSIFGRMQNLFRTKPHQEEACQHAKAQEEEREEREKREKREREKRERLEDHLNRQGGVDVDGYWEGVAARDAVQKSIYERWEQRIGLSAEDRARERKKREIEEKEREEREREERESERARTYEQAR
jgi:hypothetical protein